jgi:hypothetical protein
LNEEGSMPRKRGEDRVMPGEREDDFIKGASNKS